MVEFKREMQGKVEELFNQIKTMDFIKSMNEIVGDIKKGQVREYDCNIRQGGDDPKL